MIKFSKEATSWVGGIFLPIIVLIVVLVLASPVIMIIAGAKIINGASVESETVMGMLCGSGAGILFSTMFYSFKISIAIEDRYKPSYRKPLFGDPDYERIAEEEYRHERAKRIIGWSVFLFWVIYVAITIIAAGVSKIAVLQGILFIVVATVNIVMAVIAFLAEELF